MTDPILNLKKEWKKYLHKPWYLALWVILIFSMGYSVGAKADDFLGADVNIYLGSQMITNDHETFQVGLTLEWSRIAVDMSHGIRKTSWRVESEPDWEMDDWQSGSVFSIRGYPFRYETFRPLITWVHLSDITRGRPFNDKEEPTSDYFGVGFTYVFEQLDIDLTTGYSGRECSVLECFSGSVTRESQIQVRVYFGER